METVRDLIRDVPDFPKPGILFRDITPVLGDPLAFKTVVRTLSARYAQKGIARIAAIESRGFIFGAALAYELECGLVPIRKPGKLPCATHKAGYELEYGSDSLEVHQDAFVAGERVIIIDDLIATGGTAKAAADLVKRCGADLCELVAVIELSALSGRSKLAGIPVHALLTY